MTCRARLGWVAACLLSVQAPVRAQAEGGAVAPTSAASEHVTTSAARVVVVTPAPSSRWEAWPVAEARIRRELTIAGFELQSALGFATDDATRREELERLASELRAVAAVAVLRSAEGERAELWLVDLPGTNATIRRVDIRERSEVRIAALVGLLAVELLNASLLAASVPPASEMVNTASDLSSAEGSRVATPSVPSVGRLSLRIGVSMLWARGGLDPPMGPMVALGWDATPRLALAVRMFASLAGGEISRDGAHATAQLVGARADARVRLGPTVFGAPSVGVALGAHGVNVRGRAEAPLVERRATTWQLAPMAIVGWRLPFARTAALVLDGGVGWLIPRVRIIFGAQPVARLRSPVVEGTLSLQIGPF